MSDVTRILSQIEQGDSQAAEKLLPLVYNELRRMAGRQLASERVDHTLSPTALVHEAYLRLVDENAEIAHWNSRGHFFAAAAESMRRILVDSARQKRTIKRGGAAGRLPLKEANISAPEPQDDLLALDEALTRLEREHPSLAELVKLRYFGGLTMPQTAEALGISLRTAGRNWTYAKAWLLRVMTAVA